MSEATSGSKKPKKEKAPSAAELQAELEARRAHLADTVDGLTEQLDPRQNIAELKAQLAETAANASDEAQEFLSWLADPEGGQAVVAEKTPQFPLAPGVDSVHDLPSIDELDPPQFDQAVLSDVTTARELIIESGIG